MCAEELFAKMVEHVEKVATVSNVIVDEDSLEAYVKHVSF